MSVDDQDILRSYLQKVMELADERSAGLTEAELRAIAREVGISEEELAAAAKSARDHRIRGAGFLAHGRYDDAIAELTEATALAPGELDIQQALASAYAARYRQQGHGEDKEKAEALARRCLELDPEHQASFEILNQLDRAESPSSARSSGSIGPPARAGAVIAGLLAVALGAGLLLFRGSQPLPPRPSAAEGEIASKSAPPGPATSLAAPAAELDVPVELETELELAFDLRLSRLNNYTGGGSFYTLNAVIENRGQTELEKILARLELRDASGEILAREGLSLLSGSAPPLRPGDRHAVHHLSEVVPGIRRASLVVERVEETPAAGDYGVATPIEVSWQEPQPPAMSISARERSRRFSESVLAGDGGGYFEAVLEIENSGSRSIRALQLKVTALGPGGAWEAEIQRHVVSSSGPDLRAGGTRVVRFLKQVRARPAGYRVSVIAIR